MDLIVEHPETGQRLRVCEDHFDEPDHNPVNRDHIDFTDTGGATRHAAEPDGKSLKAAGFVPVAILSPEGEVPLPKNYEWKGGRE